MFTMIFIDVISLVLRSVGLLQRLQVALAFLTLVRNLSPLTVPEAGAQSHLGHLLHLEVPSPGFLVLPGDIQDIGVS